MKKFTEAHTEQIRNMHADGKKYREIRDFFHQTYKITLYDSQIAAVMRGSRPSPAKTLKSKGKKKVLRTEPVQEASGDEFVLHVRAAYTAFKKRFLKEVETVISEE